MPPCKVFKLYIPAIVHYFLSFVNTFIYLPQIFYSVVAKLPFLLYNQFKLIKKRIIYGFTDDTRLRKNKSFP